MVNVGVAHVLASSLAGWRGTEPKADQGDAVVQEVPTRCQEEKNGTAEDGDGDCDAWGPWWPRRPVAPYRGARLGEASATAQRAQDGGHDGGSRDKPAPSEGLGGAGFAVGRTTPAAWAVGEGPNGARVPVRRALGVCGAGRGNQRRGASAGRVRWQRWSRRDGRSIAGRAREGDVGEAARGEQENNAASGMHGHAAGTRAGGASTPSVQKRLRLGKNIWRSTTPAERSDLLPSLHVDCNPAQQTKEEEEEDEVNGGAKIRCISLNGMQQPLDTRVGGSNAKLGEKEQGEDVGPSGEASSIGRGNPIEAPSIRGGLVATRSSSWSGA